MIRHHADLWSRACPGRYLPAVNGVRAACIWCRAHFVSEDEDHRFCSAECVDEWMAGDGSWDGWDEALDLFRAERIAAEMNAYSVLLASDDDPVFPYNIADQVGR